MYTLNAIKKHDVDLTAEITNDNFSQVNQQMTVILIGLNIQLFVTVSTAFKLCEGKQLKKSTNKSINQTFLAWWIQRENTAWIQDQYSSIHGYRNVELQDTATWTILCSRKTRFGHGMNFAEIKFSDRFGRFDVFVSVCGCQCLGFSLVSEMLFLVHWLVCTPWKSCGNEHFHVVIPSLHQKWKMRILNTHPKIHKSIQICGFAQNELQNWILHTILFQSLSFRTKIGQGYPRIFENPHLRYGSMCFAEK